MAVSPRQAGDVRHDETHETDHARHRDGGSGEERGGQIHPPFHRIDIGAEIARGLLAQRQQIQGTRGSEQHGERDRRIERDDQHGIPRRSRQAAPEPQKRVAQLRRVRERHDRRRNRGGERADRHATQQQNAWIQTRAADEAEPVDEAKRGQRAEKRRDRQCPGPGQMQRDREDRAEPRAARQAQEKRIGQRITDEGLQAGTGDAE